MDRPQWPQEIVVKPMEEIVTNSSTYNNIPSKPSSSSSSFERRVIIRSSSTATKAAPHVNCPRCDSTNTKFCYYNNYSLSQPRYFCKTCRRYWTEGGTLRNIPVGGGSRKNKRSSSSSSSSYSSLVSKKLNDSDDLFVVPPASTSVLSQNPRIHQQHHHQGHYGHFNYGQDLNLGFPSSTTSSSISTTTTGSAQLSAMELLNGITTRGGITTTTTTATTRMNSFMPIPIPIQDPNSVYSSSSGAELMIPMMPEFKIPSSLGFSLDGMASGSGGYGNSSSTTTAGGGILFPFEEVKTNTQTTDHEDGLQSRDHHQNGDSNGFWNGMLGGGSW